MRIAYICQSYPPMVSGASIVAGNLVEGMAKSGHQILVCTSSDIGPYYQSLSKNIKMVRLHSYSSPMHIDKRFMIGSNTKIEKEICDFQPDVIHIHEPIISARVGLSCKKKLNVPLILTIHQVPWIFFAFFDSFPHAFRNNMEELLWGYFNWFLPQCSQAIAPTVTIADLVSSKTSTPVIAISNGININHFSPEHKTPNAKINLCQKYHLDPTLPVILHVGRIDKDKQVDLVITAAAEAMQKVEAQLLVVGDGTKLEDVKKLSELYNIQDRCHFPGYVDLNGDLPGLYQLSSVFTTASEIETQGMVLLEAAASGLPIVAVDATCVWEVVKHGVNGYLTPPKDTSSMAEKIEALVNNPHLAKKMGMKGIEISQKHAIEKTIEKHEHLYADLVKKFKTKPPDFLPLDQINIYQQEMIN